MQEIGSRINNDDRKQLNFAIATAKTGIPASKSNLIKVCLELCKKYNLKDIAERIRNLLMAGGTM